MGPLSANRLSKGGRYSVACVERKDGRSGRRRALRARAGSRRGGRGRPVLEGQVLGAADRERRNCPGVLGVLSEVPAAISYLALQLSRNLRGESRANL